MTNVHLLIQHDYAPHKKTIMGAFTSWERTTQHRNHLIENMDHYERRHYEWHMAAGRTIFEIQTIPLNCAYEEEQI